jgi:prepilin-type N-terminal cleavage/methylation domain-containing protein
MTGSECCPALRANDVVMKCPSSVRRAFTLIELLVVIAIIAGPSSSRPTAA